MGLSEEERFQFDLAGFFVREAILTPSELEAIVEQVDRIHHDPLSLPLEERSVPGGASSLLIDHPRVVDVLGDVIGPDLRLESSRSIWREQGESDDLGLHGGGPVYLDPHVGHLAYRAFSGQIRAGLVRVIFELGDVARDDGGTAFLVGSHKSEFPVPPRFAGVGRADRSDFLMSYACPAGSAVFFTESVAHVGPEWRGATPRVAVFHCYGHVGTCFHRLNVPAEVVAGLPREKQAWFREPWVMDFGLDEPRSNTDAGFVASGDPPITSSPWHE